MSLIIFRCSRKAFTGDAIDDEKILKSWSEWLKKWKSLINNTNPIYINATTTESSEKLSKEMKQVNPKYSLREWFLVPAYEEAEKDKLCTHKRVARSHD